MTGSATRLITLHINAKGFIAFAGHWFAADGFHG
jgi:hypothetical protein